MRNSCKSWLIQINQHLHRWQTATYFHHWTILISTWTKVLRRIRLNWWVNATLRGKLSVYTSRGWKNAVILLIRFARKSREVLRNVRLNFTGWSRGIHLQIMIRSWMLVRRGIFWRKSTLWGTLGWFSTGVIGWRKLWRGSMGLSNVLWGQQRRSRRSSRRNTKLCAAILCRFYTLLLVSSMNLCLFSSLPENSRLRKLTLSNRFYCARNNGRK